MSELFLSVLNMSLTASYVILFVILVRLLLKKAPKVISYALWGVVAFRLIIPFSFESMFSLMPRNTNAVPIPHDIIYQQSPRIDSGIEAVDSFVSRSLTAPTIGASVNPLQIYVDMGTYIWILGIIALLVYSFVSILILKRQLKSAELIEKNVFEAKNLKTPFLLGLIKPKIYLPVGLNATERSYILLHEQTHIHRKDHIIKVFAFLILSIHWLNPLVWIAFRLMSTDMELSCDERVLKEMDRDIKKPYANSLLSLATGRHILNGSPLAFGEGNVKGRIKNVLNYRKPGFWIIVFSIVLVTAVGIGLMANPKAALGDKSIINNTNGVSKITVKTQPGNDSSLKTTKDKHQIIDIINYINSLDLKKTTKDVGRYNGMSYFITIHYSNDTSTVYVHFGNMFFKESDNDWYEMPYNQAEKFEAIYNGLSVSVKESKHDVSEKTNIKPTAPEWYLEQTVGVDMVELDFASDDIVIFHDYFGLFVYDLNTLQIIRGLDLKPLNCHQTQGDNYCDISVSLDGNTVQLHPMSSENMLIYTVSDNTLQETSYKPMNNSFRSQFVSIEEVINSTKLGNYSHQAVLYDTGEYGYLHTEDGTIGTLSYMRGGMVYLLFDNTTQNQYDYYWDKPSDNGIIPFSGYLRKVQLKMQHEIETRDLSISEDSFSQLFSLLSKADEGISPKSESFLDGYKLMLKYESQNNQSILIKLIGFHDGKTIFADIESADGEDYLKDRTKYFQSSELVNYIQTMVEWKEYDVQNLSGVNEISVQTMFGVQKSDTTTIISGKDADTISNSIIKKSERKEAGNCGYNIKVIFKKEDGTEYRALLAGDSCPDIAIEGCVFRIDPEIIKLIYKKINYDMPIGNSGYVPVYR